MRNRTYIAVLMALWLLSTAAVRSTWRLELGEDLRVGNGFRQIGRLLAAALWQQSEVFRDTGRWWLVLPLLRVTTFLDPTFAAAYDFAGWHLAYNLRAEEKDPKLRVQWVKSGLKVYEEGLKSNPDDFALLFGMGWTAYDKLGDPYTAAYYLEKAMNAPGKFTKDIDWVVHIAAHAYERMPNFRMALALWKEAAVAAPNNPVARGATNTISERYVLAEALAANGYFAEATQIPENLMRRPELKFAPLPRHQLADIFRRRGDLESAISIMEQMTQWHAMEERARWKAERWREELERRRLRRRD
ncbi:MAG: hypothetical protein NZ959_11785 [Armatimonadetes bacterium]|nr:hypothetical protein [Armatimonadota bacterium]MDW8122995.1 hypothetical protein [Armatimonadota bacterium]